MGAVSELARTLNSFVLGQHDINTRIENGLANCRPLLSQKDPTLGASG